MEWGTNLGSSNLWSVDLNDDGHEEIIFGGSGSRGYGNYGSQFFAVLGHQQGDYNPVWTSRNYGDNGIKVIEVVETGADNTPEILVLLRDGRIEKYDGQALVLIDSFKTQAEDARAMRWGDVDSDGAPEVTIIGADYLHIYDVSTHTLEWSSSEYEGRDVEIGDVDDDGASEIVLDGYVLDGATRTIEWQYQGGFGPHLELGDLTGDGVPEIIGMEEWDYLTVFDAVHRTPTQQVNLNEDFSTLLVTDISDDERAEIIIGSGQWGSISAYGPDSLQNLWYINNPEHGTTNLAVGDPDSDGSPEVIWGAGHTSSGEDYLYVGDVTTANIEWTSTDLDGPFMAGIADADTDTLSEIIGASAQSNSGYDGGYTLVYDMPGHELIRSRRVSSYNGTSAFTSGDLDGDGEGEVIMASGSIVKILDAETLDQKGENLSLSSVVHALTLAQTDGDAPLEIIVGDAGGHVTVYDGATLTQEWKSISTGNAVIAVEIGDVDDDESREIIFANKDSYIQIYDADSHYLEWQSEDLNVSSLTLADTDQDGALEILVGRYDGGLHTIESSTFQVGPIVQVAPEAIVSIAVANVDRSSSPELLIGSSRLRLMTLAGDSLLWESANIGERVARRGDLIISDIDNDQFKDVIFGTDWGLFHYESSVPYPDFTPPTVIASIPDSGRTNVSRDVDVHVVFSELMDEGTLYSGTSLQTGNGEIISASKSYDVDASRLTLDPQAALPPSAEIILTVDGSIADTAGNTLDGNRNGISEGSPVDDFSRSFSTGSGIDVEGPVVSWSSVDPDSAWPGVPRTVTIQFSDTSSVATSTIEAAEAYVHGADTTMAGRELEAVDGAFDEALEMVEFPLETHGMLPGLHAIYVRARDNRGQWGPLSRIDIHLLGDRNASNWPMFGQNARHTGFNSRDSTATPLTLKWSKKISTSGIHPIAVYHDLVVYVGNDESSNAFVRGLDANTGEPRWQRLLGNGVAVNPPSIGYGHVFIQTGKDLGDNYQPPLLHAINAQNGELLWQSSFAAQWASYMAPTLWAGRVYVNGGYYGGMYGFDAFSGEEQWFVQLAQSDKWTPAVHDSITYAFVDGDLTAADAVSGDILWQKQDIAYNWSGSTNTAPVISTATNTIFVTSSDYLHAINLDTRQVRWQQQATFGITPAVAERRVFVVEDGDLQVYDELSGEQIWSFSGSSLFYPPVVTPSHVFVASRATTYALDRESREVVWDYNVGGPLTLANDQLFVAGTDGTLYSFVSTISDNVVEHTLPSSFNLNPGYPNPFRHSTTLAYELPEPERVTLRVYDVLGRQVDVLVDAPHAAGTHEVKWKPDGHASGTYFCQMIAGPYRKVVPLTIVR